MSQGKSDEPRAWTFTLVAPQSLLWRCGEHVVLYLVSRGQMPPVCLWTGAEVGPELSEVELCLELPNAWRWRILPLRFGYQRAFRTVFLPLPASASWVQQLQVQKARFGKRIMSTSLLCCLPLLGLLPLVYPFTDAKVVPVSLPFILLLIGCVTCLGMALVGANWTKLRGTPGPGAVRAKLTEESYVWIPAHPQFLQHLPEWPGLPLNQFDFHVSVGIGFINFFINIAIGILVAAFIIFVRMAYLFLV